MVLPVILESFDPTDPTRPDPQTAHCKAKLLRRRRRDQFVKKVWSKFRKAFYSEHKQPKTLKETAQLRLKETFGCEEQRDFEALFGASSNRGLTVRAIDFILCHRPVFDRVFNTRFFAALRRSLDEQTTRDIQINLVSRLAGFL